MKKNSDILIKVLSLGIGLAVGIVLIAKVFFELSCCIGGLHGRSPRC